MTHITRISLNVANLARSQKFFTDLLGFRKSRVPPFAPPTAQSCVLALGDQAIELVEHHPHGAPYPSGSTTSDLWVQHFTIVTADMPAAYARLQKAPAMSITNGGPQTLPPETGNVIAYKFCDPDGHPRVDPIPVEQRRAHRSFGDQRVRCRTQRCILSPARSRTDRASNRHRRGAGSSRPAFRRHGRGHHARSTRRAAATSGAALLRKSPRP